MSERGSLVLRANCGDVNAYLNEAGSCWLTGTFQVQRDWGVEGEARVSISHGEYQSWVGRYLDFKPVTEVDLILAASAVDRIFDHVARDGASQLEILLEYEIDRAGGMEKYTSVTTRLRPA